MRKIEIKSGSTSRLPLFGGAVLAALLMALPAETFASCQTEFCHYRLSLSGREREAKARQAVASDPDDAEAVRRLFDILGYKVGRERVIAEYEARYRWESPPDLAPLGAEALAERRRLSEYLLRLQPDARAWCSYAHQLPRGEKRIEVLQRQFEAHPSEPYLALCLANELVGLDRTDQALALLRAFLVERPEPSVAGELVRFLGRDEMAVLAVLETMAVRRPDDLESQRRLLAFLTAQERFARYEVRATELAEQLLEASTSLSDHRWVCWSIDHGAVDLRRVCWERLYSATLREEESEDLLWMRRDVLDSLITIAFHARDWPRLTALLPHVDAEDLPSTWSQIIDFTDGEYCPQFVAAFERGIEWTDEGQAQQVSETLRVCGEEERAHELSVRAGLLAEGATDPTSSARVEWLHERPCAFSDSSLPLWRSFADLAEDVSEQLHVAVEQSTREEPENACAWIARAALDEAAGDAEAALEAWRTVIGFQPDDLDLVVALGAAALRLDRPEVARRAAARLRRDPAAVPRHHAEADYLLGRLARREGRWDEASDFLSSYFLRRIEFAGCPVPACDQALVLHLLEAGDGQRLARYLAARKPLVDARLQQHSADSRDPRERLLHHRVRQLHTLDQAILGLDCASPRALERLEAQSAAAPKSEGHQRRLAKLRTLRPCTSDELPNPEQLFPDAELLALSWSLREVG